jgi:hypothetical protein
MLKTNSITNIFKNFCGLGLHLSSRRQPVNEGHERNKPLLVRANEILEDLTDALDAADQEDNELCLTLSNYADDTADFIFRMSLTADVQRDGE